MWQVGVCVWDIKIYNTQQIKINCIPQKNDYIQFWSTSKNGCFKEFYIYTLIQTNKPSFLKIQIQIRKQTISTEVSTFLHNADQEVNNNVSEINTTSIFKVKSIQP